MKISAFGAMPQTEERPQMQIVPATETTDPTQFLDFSENKVQVITLDQLKLTNLENRGDNRECPHGIYHFALIQRLLDMCEKAGYDVEVYDLFATNNKEKQTPGVSLYPELEARFGKRSVKATTLRRVFANVRIKNFDDENLTTNLAVSYTQRGIQVGFGTNVKLCHNQNFLGTGRFVADYTISNHYASGENYKADLNGIFDRVGSWLTNAQHVVIEDRETIKKMKETYLTAEQLYVIIGMLTSIRVACDTANKEIRYTGGIYPLNQTQIGKFTEELLVEQKHVGQISAWALYNAATNIYKPTTCEQNLIMPQNMAMYDFMKQQEIF